MGGRGLVLGGAWRWHPIDSCTPSRLLSDLIVMRRAMPGQFGLWL